MIDTPLADLDPQDLTIDDQLTVLDRWSVPPETKDLIRRGYPEDDPDRYAASDGERITHRAFFHALNGLDRCEVPAEMIARVVLDRRFGISAYPCSKRNPLRLIERTLRWAREHQADFDRYKNGNVVPSFLNARRAIARLGITCEYDEFRGRARLAGHEIAKFAGELSDHACLMLRQLIIERFGFDPRDENVQKAALQWCLENSYDPVRDYLDQLVWDGVERIDSWLVDHLGAADTPYTRAVGSKTLIAGVRRVRSPGCKKDEIPILEGAQGSGKSSAIKILAGGEEFFSDEPILGCDKREVAEAVEGVWIYELGELVGLNKADSEKIKTFASKTHDRARKAYARFRENQPRRSIFIGTTNHREYLRDVTGNRRFWPVRTGAIDLDALRYDRDQLWAEAAHREAQGESIELPRELWTVAAEEQKARCAEDPWMFKVENNAHPYIGQVNDEWRILTSDLLEHVVSGENLGPAGAQRLAALMHALGWDGPKTVRLGDRRGRGYVRANAPEGWEESQEGGSVDFGRTPR